MSRSRLLPYVLAAVLAAVALLLAQRRDGGGGGQGTPGGSAQARITSRKAVSALTSKCPLRTVRAMQKNIDPPAMREIWVRIIPAWKKTD